ncbi:MAG: hypothetical protein M1815_002860 [Lichina confinis]|nr:MAG: hypothetical protein M1815_002860 [Lichina confinis]
MCLYRQLVYSCGHRSALEQKRECRVVRDQLYRINQSRYGHRPDYLPFAWPSTCHPNRGNVSYERRPGRCRECASYGAWRFVGYGGWT